MPSILGFDSHRRLQSRLAFLALFAAGTGAFVTPEAAGSQEADVVEPRHFLQILSAPSREAQEALTQIGEHWQEGFVAPLLELLRFSQAPLAQAQLVHLLRERTGRTHDLDVDAWYQWLWNREVVPYAQYAEFKAALYSRIDPVFDGYFSSDRLTEVRLDEVIWGGVLQDGIPPLRAPKMLAAVEASYLDDADIIFGLEVDGDVRAYPKRIMAWHEMFVDTVGGVPVAGVYCTLCGSMVLYETTRGGVEYYLGTSGFLFRSNKLMYDRVTQSLWNTLWGRPVIGPLVGQGITLNRRSILTTTWGEWRRRHPETKVLSLETGHRRDYSEGAAYRDYFATDRLMFTVPELDDRLANKAEVLALLFDQHPDQPLAISAELLERNRLYHDRIGEIAFVVLTDVSGANRVYETDGLVFTDWDDDRTLVDEGGGTWTLSEAGLESSTGDTLERLPAHRAFWFGWYAAFSETRLVR